MRLYNRLSKQIQAKVFGLIITNLASNSLAVPALMSKVQLVNLPICKTLSCKETTKYISEDSIMGKYVYVEYITNAGYFISASYTMSGLLSGADLTIYRNPVDEYDKKVILKIFKDMVGANYEKEIIDSCLSVASAKANFNDYFSGQVGLAGGKTPQGVPWNSTCWTFVKSDSIINRISIDFAY
ncbi:hypothetical protein [Deinococcus sp.]|uniref:hypothetical protein n=1 Tax=Deinococcus sp. TaxID=47478 RepID=UPI003CC5A93A